jgi:hypothetical protein
VLGPFESSYFAPVSGFVCTRELSYQGLYTITLSFSSAFLYTILVRFWGVPTIHKLFNQPRASSQSFWQHRALPLKEAIMNDRTQLGQAIAHLESLQNFFGNIVVDAMLAFKHGER